jgi:Uma2 family endonuclease
MVIGATTYEQVALEDVKGFWELDRGHLRQKPGMTAEHNDVAWALQLDLASQLDRREFRVDLNQAHLRIPNGSFYIPDVVVIPRAFTRRAKAERSRGLEVYEEPMPLVVEVWSPSTGDYDVETKLREYQRRGDAEIWRLHPYERTLTAWHRQPDGSYSETVYRDVVVEPVALPGVRIDLESLFEP